MHGGNDALPTATGYIKLQMYKIGDLQTRDVQKPEIYNHIATGCTNYTEPDIQKKVCRNLSRWDLVLNISTRVARK